MARNESDREDLMAEAVGLVNRVEMEIPGFVSPVIAGFRTSSRLSLYFGSDPVYQFDDDGRLRRAYVSGLLYRTQGATLARLRRERSNTETVLLRYDLTQQELVEFQTNALRIVAELRSYLVNQQAQVLRIITSNEDNGRLMADLMAGLDRILSSTEFLSDPIVRRN